MSSQLNARTFDILLAEDNPADVYLFRQALLGAEIDFRLTVIEDGHEALAFVRRDGEYTGVSIPDLVVLDLNLPKFGGIEILEALRRNNELKRVPVFIMTSSAEPRERARAIELDIARFITKPLDLAEFLQIGYMIKEILLQQASKVR